MRVDPVDHFGELQPTVTHCPNEFVTIANILGSQMMPVKGKERLRDQPGEPLVPVRERVIAIDGDHQRGSLVVERWIDLFNQRQAAARQALRAEDFCREGGNPPTR
ncbi:hypothetical protein NQ160_02640 [Microbacterium sp. zg.Y909]|nr:hypothetical protein [Microbacterium sp. zg.Y909]MCR2824424.1 hypothetical protein [Microbacterium sp. zg.Y909]